jgi:hypothetical protein
MKRCFNKAFPTLGPMPLADLTGHGVAALELMASTRPETKHASHSQYDTIRKLRSALSSLRTASPQGGSPNLRAGRDLRGSSIILFDFPTDSEWWKRFLLGMKIRMGQDVRPQKLGFSVEVILVLLNKLEDCWRALPKGNPRRIPWGLWPILLSLSPFGLRGIEGFKLDL